MKVTEKLLPGQYSDCLRPETEKTGRKLVICCLLSAVCLFYVSGCAWQNSDADTSPQYTVGVVLKSMDSEHWLAVRAGLQQAAHQYNVNVIILCPRNETAVDEQRRMIFDLLKNNIDALIVAPCDVDESGDYVQLAREKNIPFFTIDEKIEGIPYIGSDNFRVGSLAARELIRHMGSEPGQKIAVICGNKNQNAHVQRVDGFRQYVEEYTDFEIAGEAYADSSFEKAYKETETIMKENPDVNGLFVTSAVMGLGSVQALEDMHMEKKVHIVGVDRQDDFILEVRQNKVDAIVAQDGNEIGALAVKTVADALNNKEYPLQAYVKNSLITAQNAEKYLAP